MAVLDFPATPSEGDKYVAENGVVYTWTLIQGVGYWSGVNSNDTALDGKYLKLDTSNGPLTGNLGLPGGGGDADALQKQEIVALISTDISAADVIDDATYLKLDASNGPVTGALDVNGLLTADAGVTLTGGFVRADGDKTGTVRSFLSSGQIDQDTTEARLFYSNIGYTGTGTIPSVYHFQAQPNRPTSTLTITEQMGFYAGTNLIADTITNAYGFYGELDTGAGNNYNFYAVGTAPNFFEGDILTAGSFSNKLPQNANNTVLCVNTQANHAGQDVTTTVNFAVGRPENVTGNRQNLVGYEVNSSFGADYTDGSRAAYGFSSNLPSASNGLTYNFYASGSAPNYFNGKTTVDNNFTVGTTAINPVTAPSAGCAIRSGGTLLTNVQGSDSPHQFRRDTDGKLIRFHNNSTSDVGSISVTAAATSYNESSDYRLKSNIQPLSSTVDLVKQLKPCSFDINGINRRGFIAHEVQEVEPIAVTGEKDAVDEEGNPDYQSVDASKLIPLLTKALQEALTEIDALKARVAALES